MKAVYVYDELVVDFSTVDNHIKTCEIPIEKIEKARRGKIVCIRLEMRCSSNGIQIFYYRGGFVAIFHL